MSLAPNGQVQIDLGTPYNVEDPKSQFRIEDRASGQTILVFDLTQVQLTALIRGSVFTVPAWIVPPELRDRLGRKLHVRHLEVPMEVAATYDRDAKPQAEEWAEANKLPGEVAWVAHHRDGWGVTFQSWDEPEEVES